jgi:hypothetical protein
LPLSKDVDKYITQFKAYIESKEGQDSIRDRHEREQKLQTILSRKNVKEMTESGFGEVISTLWANQSWTNKTYLVKKIIEDNGFETLKQAFSELLWGEAQVAQKYDKFRSVVKGMGPAQITEIMSFVHPKDYGLWNARSREGLAMLDLLPTKKYQISGAEYERCIEAFRQTQAMLEQRGFQSIDLIDVDFFLYFLQEQPGQETKVGDFEFDHDEVSEKLEALGVGLGFDVEREKRVAKGAQLDVVWSTKIGNLGMVSYAFEVQGKGGSIDSLLMNLQKAKNDPTVQKIVAVSDIRTLNEIRDEANEIKDLKDAVAYLDVKDVEKASQLIQELGQILTKLQLVKTAYSS